MVSPPSPSPLSSTDRSVRGTPYFRLAVIGGGPRGAYALDALAGAWLAGRREGRFQVDVYEPHPFPGAGPNYDPRQPDYLRMNFANEKVHMWAPNSRGWAGCRGPSLTAWLAEHAPEWASPHGFAPRARVGEYLHAGFLAVVDTLTAAGIDVRVIPARVERVAPADPAGSGWWVETETYDEVLLAVGHESRGRDDFGRRFRRALGDAFLDAVFPVDPLLDADRVPSGCRVAVRGFALTWIDAALALTEGRGGAFEAAPELSGLFTYRPSGKEPASIVPFSRSGKPLLAKPEPRRMDLPEGLGRVWAEGRRELLDHGPGAGEAGAARWLEEVLVCRSAEALVRVRQIGEEAARSEVREELHRRLTDRGPASARVPERVAEEMRASLASALGHRPPGPAWALGEGWRRLYPAIVERVSHGGLPVEDQPAFGRLAREMERVAFGPPALNLAKMLALVEAGIVDLGWTAAPEVTVEEGKPVLRSGSGATCRADVLVDAVSPASGADESSPVLGELLQAGLLRLQSGTSGTETTREARAVDARGEPVPGLSLVGRAAEGCILGHDTLSRTLHPHLGRWAKRVVERAAQGVGTAVRGDGRRRTG